MYCIKSGYEREIYIPRVSVIIPIYNAERYIGRCIKNLENQTMQDFEVIFMDDQSTDKTVEVLLNLCKSSQKFHVYKTDMHKGAGAMRNKGIIEANGKYVIFLDVDDEYSPGILERASKSLDETEADLVAFNFRRIYTDGTIEERIGIHEEQLIKRIGIFNYTDCPKRIMQIVNPTPWNKMYRLSYIREKNLRFEEIPSCNDITFSAVSVALAKKISYIRDSLYSYYMGQSGTITSSKGKNINCIVTAVRSVYHQTSKLSYFPEIEDSVIKFIVDNLIVGCNRYIDDWRAVESREYFHSVQNIFRSIPIETIERGRILSERNTVLFFSLREMEYENFLKEKS